MARRLEWFGNALREDFKVIGRRRFLVSTGAVLGASAFGLGVRKAKGERTQSLIPSTRSTAPNYWCTWAAQNYLYGQDEQELEVSLLEDDSGAKLARDLLNESTLVGPHGWTRTVHPRIRDELYLLVDDGWEEGGTASFELDRAKFPSFKGSPQERLRRLNDSVRADGWRALALWCRNTPGGDAARERVSWSKFAGIPYLKVDRGDRSGSLARACASQNAPILLEHIHQDDCLNGDWKGDGRFGAQHWGTARLQILCTTDVYRTYDATAILGIPTTIDRAAELLKGAAGHSEAKALLNVEDEVYIAAVLGCSMGVMRHPFRGLRPGSDLDVFLPMPRLLKQRMDEVVRAIRWQRIAPPYAAGSGSVALDSRALTDEWVFRHGDTFASAIVGVRVRQGAPARVSRNMELPIVSGEGELPYVVCNRFPGGAAAIGAFERLSTEKPIFLPRAHVRWALGNIQGPLGIFGQFGSLTLSFDQPLRSRRILAQDLAGDAPIDITDEVRIKRTEMTLSGDLIDRIGRSSGTLGDLSMPGLVLTI